MSNLNKKQKSILMRFRDALQKSGLVFSGDNIEIADSETGHYVRFNYMMTNSDYNCLELSVEEYFEKPVLRAWRTVKDKVREE